MKKYCLQDLTMTDVPMSFEKLKEFLGYERPSDVIKWLDNNHIPWLPAKNKEPVTTMSAINKAIIGDEDDDEIEFA